MQKRQNGALTKITDNIEALYRLIKTREDSAAMSDWDMELEVPISSIAPEYFRVGSLKMVNTQGTVLNKINIPLLLPTKVNAVMMNLGNDADKVPDLFQSLILRILMSLRMDFTKVSVVDMDFGNSFPVVSSINNYAGVVFADGNELPYAAYLRKHAGITGDGNSKDSLELLQAASRYARSFVD